MQLCSAPNVCMARPVVPGTQRRVRDVLSPESSPGGHQNGDSSKVQTDCAGQDVGEEGSPGDTGV